MEYPITITMNGQKLWRRIMGANPECFGNHWRKFRYVTGAWDLPGKVAYEIGDPNGEEVEGGLKGFIDLDLLALGYQRALESDAWATDLGEQDCVSADAICQLAIFGEVVYG